MDYNKTEKSYLDYTNMCKMLIKNTFFTSNDLDYIDISDDNLSIDDIVKKHRLKMIDIKLEHTMRMIEQVINMNNNLGLKVELGLVLKVAVLYHDIGRMRQSTWSNTFNDNIYIRLNKPFKNHSEDGYNIFINNDFNVDKNYIPIIASSILNHQDLHNKPKLNYKYTGHLSNINIDDIVTGNI